MSLKIISKEKFQKSSMARIIECEGITCTDKHYRYMMVGGITRRDLELQGRQKGVQADVWPLREVVITRTFDSDPAVPSLT